MDGAIAASAHQTSAGTLILVSRMVKARFDLVLVENLEHKGRIQAVLREAMTRSRKLQGIDAVSLRENFSTGWGSLLTAHILYILESEQFEGTDVVSDTAWRYAALTAWGESSAARELAISLQIPVHTIHSRLRLARDRGILPSPGAGSRRGR